MPLQNVENLTKLIESQNLEALSTLAVATKRIQNRSLGFRSCLMLSTHNLKHLTKIPTLNAECIILNLEDGVSMEQKPYVLRLCAMVLAAYPQLDKKMVVRINALDEGGFEEIAYLNAFMPDAIRIPKIRSVDEVKKALELIDESIEVHLSIETKEAWLALSTLACHPRVKAYYLGVLDFFADLGLSQSLLTPQNPTMQYMLSHFLMTARACGVKPVSFVYQDYKNSDGLRNWLELEKTIGLDAKGCITPAQVEAVHEIFGHSEAEIHRCETIVKVFEEHKAKGVTGFVDEQYGFIDEPIYKGALAVLASLK
ncbi:MAG TPA: aldolase/citrate lyase family protein [Sulfuricurvum sp.]|nr:MAG: CoA ester lyase [Campylobacterales bacterium 16-40-21]OZA04080.1 MAG: CoA ester lyase [Sulfuricurvum sp. 17-40-25]HQS66083.1 aldolase/citrate lyase family protein [Sulfuricurvum sp.]HQT35873.1 aldolase/citrate lyase family protein [Sulfuricurvum sp.]